MTKTTLSRNPPSPTTAHISDIAVTSDTLTGRGGLALFSRYVRNIGIFAHLERLFGALRRSGKGLGVSELFHQLFCFLADGTSPHLVYFDTLKEDEGYARGIETEPERMASSHAIKRFFGAFQWGRIWVFRHLLRQLFLWRLEREAPAAVVLGLDTMVMDNDEAHAKQGCEPTYKKVKGFQPLQLTWGPYVVDALFRGGKKHGNAGEVAGKMVEDAVAFLRKRYRDDVAVIVRMDAGFFDQKLFRAFEEAGIGYLCSGKLEEDLTDMAQTADPAQWREYDNGRQLWHYLEFGVHRPSWKKGEWRRAFYTRPAYEEEQRLLEFARPDQVIYTNLGLGGLVDERLREAGCEGWLRPSELIELHHGRGRDELVHRALKDFRAEQLPFKQFQANAAFYYTVLVGFFLFESFKRDVTEEVVPITAQATRLRREVMDFAAKIVRSSGKVLLKVTAALWTRLRLRELWERTAHPPPFAWA